MGLCLCNFISKAAWWDHAPYFETRLGSAVLTVFSWQFVMPKWYILNLKVQA